MLKAGGSQISQVIGNVDTSNIMEFIQSLPDKAWDEFTVRQDKHGPHKYTKTIGGIYPELDEYPKIGARTFTYTEELAVLYEPIYKMFCDFYDKSFAVTAALVVRMPPNSNIDVHIDEHNYFGEAHRVHWCLGAEYDKLDFRILDHKIKMEQGNVVYINNRLPHSATYKGKKPRYNLIIDFL